MDIFANAYTRLLEFSTRPSSPNIQAVAKLLSAGTLSAILVSIAVNLFVLFFNKDTHGAVGLMCDAVVYYLWAKAQGLLDISLARAKRG